MVDAVVVDKYVAPYVNILVAAETILDSSFLSAQVSKHDFTILLHLISMSKLGICWCMSKNNTSKDANVIVYELISRLHLSKLILEINMPSQDNQYFLHCLFAVLNFCPDHNNNENAFW